MRKTPFRCFECIGEACNVPAALLSTCNSTINCWKSSFRYNDTKVQFARGCVSTQKHNQDICNNITQAMHVDYRYTCCDENFCNIGEFPTLSERQVSLMYYLFFTTLIAIGFLLLVGVVRIVYNYEKRMRFALPPRRPSEIDLDDMSMHL